MRRSWKVGVALMAWMGEAVAVTGDEVIAEIDNLSTKYEDQFIVYEAVTAEEGKDPRSMVFSVTLKGEMRLVEFRAPGDVKGSRVLVLKRNQMYIYMPSYNKVRRVASHVTGQGFMGTTFSDEDMSTSLYGPLYESRIQADTEQTWVIDLTPKTGTETPYGSLRFTVSKEGYRVQEIQYFGDQGQHLKTETRENYRCVEEVCSPERIKMVDHTRGDAASTLMMEEFSANNGVEDDVFTVRNLMRGD